jgi:hypothetical protein
MNFINDKERALIDNEIEKVLNMGGMIKKVH